MNATRGNRLHIGFFGKTNVGKSSLVNKIIGQDLSIVSETKGTTTDVNKKSMELLPIGPVVLMDTAGLDDETNLGGLRVKKTLEALNSTDVAVVVFDERGIFDCDIQLLKNIKSFGIKILIVQNKTDLSKGFDLSPLKGLYDEFIALSSLCDDDLTAKFKKSLIKILPDDFVNDVKILADIVKAGETCVLVIPIDKEAPKGRIILPQVNVIRELLDIGAVAVLSTEKDLEKALLGLKEAPKLVVTDSQAFKEVDKIVPSNVMLTSFSILFARLKGDLETFIKGANAIDSLLDNDNVLVLESCSHHPIEDDIGRVKIPNLIKKFTGKKLNFEHYSGHDLPEEIEKYKLIVHCGACMTNRREILTRITIAERKNVPITNYGIAIAKCLSISDRVIKPFNIEI